MLFSHSFDFCFLKNPKWLGGWVGNEVGEDTGEERGVGRNFEVFEKWWHWIVYGHWRRQTEGEAGSSRPSWVAGDFIPKAAVTDLFPEKESVTVYIKGRIAQQQSRESYFTWLRDGCQNVLGHLPLFQITGNGLAVLGEDLGYLLDTHLPFHKVTKIFVPVMWKNWQQYKKQAKSNTSLKLLLYLLSITIWNYIEKICIECANLQMLLALGSICLPLDSWLHKVGIFICYCNSTFWISNRNFVTE